MDLRREGAKEGVTFFSWEAAGRSEGRHAEVAGRRVGERRVEVAGWLAGGSRCLLIREQSDMTAEAAPAQEPQRGAAPPLIKKRPATAQEPLTNTEPALPWPFPPTPHKQMSLCFRGL